MSKYYTFLQNNSGGYFIEDENLGIGSLIIIESESANQANQKLEEIGSNYSGFHEYCECCGERWCSVDEDDGKEVPELFGNNIYTRISTMFRDMAYIHKIDGTIERVDLK